MTPKRITLKDIAEEAGVSKTIVSKVINGREAGRVSEEKLARIRELIAKYDYVPLSSAQSLATRRTKQIAFLLSDETSLLFENPVFARMLSGVLEYCRKKNYTLQTDYHDFRNINTFVIPENLRKRGVDGCILSGSFSPGVLEEIARIRIPAVVLGGEGIRNVIPSVTRNSKPEYEELLRYCYERGHRFIMLSGCGSNALKLYPLLAKSFPGMELELYGEDTIEAAPFLAERIAGRPVGKRPSMFLGNELMCCGVLSALQKYKLKCPDDISVIASSGCSLSGLYYPALTTYSADFKSYGTNGAELLIEMIEQDLSIEEAVDKARSIEIRSRFTERGSVAVLN